MKTVIEELKQRMIAKSTKIIDQKKIYKELNGGEFRTNDIPNTEESRRYWGDIWTVEKEHNKDAEWLAELRDEVKGGHTQERVTIRVTTRKKFDNVWSNASEK